jgi:hypothetical protein
MMVAMGSSLFRAANWGSDAEVAGGKRTMSFLHVKQVKISVTSPISKAR